MVEARIQIDFNARDVMARSRTGCDAAQFDVANQVLIDSNFYCKRDTGMLIESAIINSLPEQGIVQWVTPYAAMQYSNPATRTEINPNAAPEWFDVAKRNHCRQWIDVYRASYAQAFGGGSP